MGILNRYLVQRIENYKGWILYYNGEVYSAKKGHKFITGAHSLDILKQTIVATIMKGE